MLWATKLVLSLLLVATATSAASGAGFQGVWMLELGKSEFGLCRPVANSIVRVEAGPGGFRVIELTADASGDHVINKQFGITQRHGRTLTLRPEPRELSVEPEQWTLFGHRGKLVIERSCSASQQRLVFRRSVGVRE